MFCMLKNHDSTPLIEAVNLVKTYSDGTQALRGASFVIQEGEFVAIMGPSGSGKSTLLHILGFLDPQTSGTYSFSGKKFEEFTPKELARVRNEELGFVFQQFNLMPRQTVLENIYMPLYYSSVPKKDWYGRAERAIAQVGLTHRINLRFQVERNSVWLLPGHLSISPSSYLLMSPRGTWTQNQVPM